MDAEYGSRYRELYDRHWWWRARERIVLRELHALNPADDWGSILDVGCGDGLFLPKLSELGTVEGVEPDATLVSPASRQRWDIHIQPFDTNFRPERRYDLVLFLDVLEHLEEPVNALRHALDMLSPDGTIFVTVPAFPALWTSHDEANHHFVRYTKKSFAKVAGAAGMKLLSSRYFYHWMFGPKLIIRGWERVRRRTGNPQMPGIPPALACRLLEGLSVAESTVLGPLRLPFGSSLLVVGKNS